MLRWLRRLGTRVPAPPAADWDYEARLAEAALIRGDFAQADISYKSLAENWPGKAFTHSRRGRALVQLGRPDEALGEFKRALELDPNEPEALFGRGLMAEARGAQAEALGFFERAFAPPHRHTEAGLKLADAALARGSTSDAIDMYHRVIEFDPREGNIAFGQAAMMLGREADAIQAFNRALTLAPDSPWAKAATVFQTLFPAPSARKPKSIRPLICIPLLPAYYRDWLGGQAYLVNFTKIISNLPKAQRPRIVVAALWNDEEDADTLKKLCASLFETDAVVGVVNKSAELIHAKPTLVRAARRRNGKGSAGLFVRDLMSTVDWTFPILYPMWQVPAIPGPLFWIPDLQHRFLPLFFSDEEVKGRDRDMGALAMRMAPIVFSSRSSQQHFLDNFPSRRCRTHIWHFVSQPEMTDLTGQAPLGKLGLPRRFYYTPNQFWRHKNHATLFHALRRLLDGGHDITFVCTGSDLLASQDEYSRELLLLIESLSLKNNLRLLGVLPRAVQIEIMRSCCAVIQPSLFEGWSTVIEDALAIGRPIIASDLPVHREQLGSKGKFFDPTSVEALAAAVISLDKDLTPGPDAEREAAALRDLETRMQESAAEFLEILRHERAASV